MPQPKAYRALEDTIVAVVRAQWSPIGRALVAALRAAIVAGDHTAAYAAAGQITLKGVVAPVRSHLQELGTSALILGASQLHSPQNTLYVRGKGLPRVLDHGLDQLTVMIEDDVGDHLRRRAFEVLRNHEQATLAPYHTIGASDVAPDTAELLDEIDALVAWGNGYIGIDCALVMSRLVSYGFLDQALLDGLDSYAVSEILDDRECPVCATMDGRVFDVAPEFARIERLLSEMDPAALIAASPWPGQTAQAIAQLHAMSNAELQSEGWASPPYHPNCRGFLVSRGTS